MTNQTTSGNQRHPAYMPRALERGDNDAYRADRKLPEPTICPSCGAVFRKGRWQWGMRPEQAEESECPACQRIHDNMPAGSVRLSGGFFDSHREEMLNLVHNETDLECAGHPLERIIEEKAEEGGMLITTTGTHLAHRIGEALHRAYRGELHSSYAEGEHLLQVYWSR